MCQRAVAVPGLESCKYQAYRPCLGRGDLTTDVCPEKPHPLDPARPGEVCALIRILQSLRYEMLPVKGEARKEGDSRSKAVPGNSHESLRESQRLREGLREKTP